MKRTFVSLFLAIALVLTGCKKAETSIAQEHKEKPRPVAQEQKKTPRQEKQEEISASAEGTKSVHVDFRSIQGRKLGGLYADIVGVSGVVPAKADINYHERLANLWLRKLDRKKVSPATIKNAMAPIELYKKEPKKMPIAQFVKEAEKQVAFVKKNLDFASACGGYKLSPHECDTWKALAIDVRGVDLVAYGLTELMPSAEGNLNVKILDIVLRNAGSNYIFTIPALYDQMLSLGFYQFTSYAVNSNTHAGASRMNQYLAKGSRIPGSVISLHNGEHHRAAYLFALDNFANLAKRTNEKEFIALKRALKQKPGDIVTYMAVAHHAPGLALKCAKHWLAKGAKGSLNEHLVGRLIPYGKKSDHNLAALEALLG